MTRLRSLAAISSRISLFVAMAVIASLSVSGVAHAQKPHWVSFVNKTQQTLNIYTSDLEFLDRVSPGRQGDEIDFNTGERVGAFNPATNQWLATMAINRTGAVIISNTSMNYQGAPQQGNIGNGGGQGGTTQQGNGQQGGGGQVGNTQGNGGQQGIAQQGGGGQSSIVPANVADEVLRLINVERTKIGRKPVTRDASIDAIVAAHNTHLAAQPQYPTSSEEAHVGFNDRDEKIRDLAPGTTTKGEIVGASVPGANVAQQLVNGWMNSPGHAAILLSPMTGTGLVGIAVNTNSEWSYGTCFFADRVEEISQSTGIPFTLGDEITGGGSTGNTGGTNEPNDIPFNLGDAIKEAGIGGTTSNNATPAANDQIAVTIFNADLNPAKITLNGVETLEAPGGPSMSIVQAKEGDVVGFKSASNQGAIRVSLTNKAIRIVSTTKPTVKIQNTSKESIDVFVTTDGVETKLKTVSPKGIFFAAGVVTRGSTLVIRTPDGSSSRIVNNNISLTYSDTGLTAN